MPEQPLVSVIIPTFNYGQFIGDALHSLRVQTHENWEAIVVDDGSTDDTAAIVASHQALDQRIRYCRQRNQKQAVAKNLGLQHSRGKYVQFLDADDRLESKKLENHVAFLEQHPDADIVYGGARYFKTEAPDSLFHSISCDDQRWMPETSGKGRELLCGLLTSNILPINSAVVRLTMIREVGLFDPELPPVEDWDFWIRCAMADKAFHFFSPPDSLALIRSHSASSSRDNYQYRRAELRMRQHLHEQIDGAGVRRMNREMINHQEGWIGAIEISRGKRAEGFRLLVKAALTGGQLKWRLKWLSCAFVSPWVRSEDILEFTAVPLRGNFQRFFKRQA